MPSSKSEAQAATASQPADETYGAAQVVTLELPGGPGRLYVYPAEPVGTRPNGGRDASRVKKPWPPGVLVLGHGAGGGVGALDLQQVAVEASAAGWSVVLMEQPWRTSGRKVATAPAKLDLAFVAAVRALRAGGADVPVPGLVPLTGPLILGGRSAGARVACRTATDLGADGVLCLAFPLHPPGRPEKSRITELVQPAAAGLPVLVVQGARDAFGSPDAVRAAVEATVVEADDTAATARPTGVVEVVEVKGDHGLKADPPAVAGAVQAWLSQPR